MSELPTSGFDPQRCAIALWEESVRVRAGLGTTEQIASIAEGNTPNLAGRVCSAVKSHLMAVARLQRGGEELGAANWADPLPEWDAVLSEVEHETASLTPRSHAFHMRLARKYADYYRGFETKALVEWVSTSRMRSEFLAAIAISRTGDLSRAAEMADDISERWRRDMPVRMPGLLEIERAGSSWADVAQKSSLSQRLADRAHQLTDRLAPYPDDEPSTWQEFRTREQIVRFGFAATVFPQRVSI
ncbi:hypothetical protein [Rhizobium leguminosarum]|uniref:hypothetical protein n=1 Tax=Rhizobium leguminosarum TaxID=384 RepID=UPI003F9D1FEE